MRCKHWHLVVACGATAQLGAWAYALVHIATKGAV